MRAATLGPMGEEGPAGAQGEPRHVGERALARVLLVQACEQSDPDARFLAANLRLEASQRADAPESASRPEIAAFLARRAEPLARHLLATHRALRAAFSLSSLRIPVWLVLGASLAAGLATDALGPAKHISLIAIPLLGLVAWNLGVYVALGLGRLFARAGRGQTRSRVTTWLLRGSAWLASPARPWIRTRAAEESAWVAASLRAFFARWAPAARPLLALRVRRLLHVGAAGFAAGVVLGMYVGGFAFEYRATWESTFLEAPGVERLLSTVLWPAARLLGVGLPGVDALARLEAPGDGEASLWIHLWALTAGLAILAPRSLLALGCWVGERRLSNTLAPRVDDAYALLLLAPARGEGLRVELLPYSYRPERPALERVRELLLDTLGNRARLSVQEPVAYGADPPPGLLAGGDVEAAASPPEVCLAVVFNLAQSPEQEVHGEFLGELKTAVEAAAGRATLLALIDEDAYRSRMGETAAHDDADGEGRLAERRAAWQRVARSCELELVPLWSGAPRADRDERLGALRASLWPAGPREAA